MRVNTEDEAEILRLTRQLLDAIANADWATYERLCAPDLSAFEPEACGYLVEGMDFHKFYFDNQSYGRVQITISAPHVKMLGPDSALIAYVRLNQKLDKKGRAQSTSCTESRVWVRREGTWQHVHFHRS